MKIKIKCPAGKNLEIMIFRYLKTLVFDKFFKKLHDLMFSFLKSIICNNKPPLFVFMIIRLCPPIYTYSFQQNRHDHKKFGRFHQIPHFSGGHDAMIYLVLNRLGQLLFSLLLSMLFLMVFRFTVMDFIWMQEPSIF